MAKPNKPKKEDTLTPPPKSGPAYDASTATDVDPSGRKLPRNVLLHFPGEQPEEAILQKVSSTDPNIGAVIETADGDELLDVPGWHGKQPQPGFTVWTETKASKSDKGDKGNGAGSAAP